MVKIYYGIIIIGLLMAGLFSPVQPADASKEKMYVSNRVKIVRPTAEVPQNDAIVPGTGIQTTDKEVAAVPASEPSTSAAGDTRTAMPVPDEASDSAAVSDKSPELQTSQLSEKAIKSEFASLMGAKEKFYTRKGRIDPFEPFLRAPEPEISADTQAELNRRVPRTPLEKIDLSQLKLTGVLRAEGKTRALVQEVSGKGYIVDEGTYIGNKGGQVSKILKDRIMVSEKALDVFGKITVLERELKLQQ
ncbi:MAG: pilus assembly protein PilP [Desulfosalsimonadaceae bacterium]